MRLDTMFPTRAHLVAHLMQFMGASTDNDGQIVLYTDATLFDVREAEKDG
jgi:hypothetical protein